MEKLFKQTLQEDLGNFMEKKQDDSMGSTCSSSSDIKDELPKAKEKSKKRD